MMSSIIGKICNKWEKHVARKQARFVNRISSDLKGKIYEYQKEICRRSQIPLGNIKQLAQPIAEDLFYANTTDFSEALFYGDLQALLDYSGLSFMSFPPTNLGVQHGYVFEIRKWEKSKLDKRNLVWSSKLVDMYHQYTTNPNVYAIGAPFFYAKPHLNKNQLIEEKQRLGKNLLAFPMHSQSDVDTNYDPDKFLGILSEERKRFDTVRVCMYWKDVLRGSHKIFEDAGFECVCNGHLFDPNFLCRQKTLFELADATISNGVGSHIGYSIFMNKPHWLIDDEYEYVNTQATGDADDLTDVTQRENFLMVKRAFLDNTDYIITQQQRDVVDVFWGISEMKAPEIIRDILVRLYESD